MRTARQAVMAGRRRSAGGRVRFSVEAQQVALDHVARRAAAGGTLKAASRELGIGYETLRRWQREAQRPRLRAVEVAPVPLAPALVMVLPGGARIEGLDLAGVVELATQLR